MKLKIAIISSLVFMFSFSSIQAKVLTGTIYGYHLKPPFIVDLKKEVGLYFDFSTYMNSKQKKYNFVTKFSPKKRVHKLIAEGKLDGALIGVNPLWYGDKGEKKYLWTPKVFRDQDEFVSLKTSPFEFKGPKSLIGKKIGGVNGFYYWSLTKIDKKDYRRHNVKSELSVLEMLLKNRVDTGIISQSTLTYLIRENTKFQGKLHISKSPHEAFDRRVLVPHSEKKLYEFMKPLMENMASDPAWKKYLNKYK